MELIDKYTALLYGYVFGFVGSVALWEKIALAALLGFVGALGGWLFDQIKKACNRYVERKGSKLLGITPSYVNPEEKTKDDG